MNIFNDLLTINDSESFSTLLQNHKVKIERIISSGQITPENAPCCQGHDEWVIVLQGHAILKVENKIQELNAGDSCYISANSRHWVTFTSSQPDVIWLAVHIF